jgi:hypothetical protein
VGKKSKKKRPKSPQPAAVTAVDTQQLLDLLERTQSVLSSEDRDLIERLINSHIELTKLLRTQGTTIARLRRLFGLKGSEKLSQVLGNEKSAGRSGEAGATGASDGRGNPEATGEDNTGQVAPQPPDKAGDKNGPAAGQQPAGDAKAGKGASADGDGDDKPAGHGRIPASAYLLATHIPVSHQHLHAGDICPACGRGKVYRLPDPSPVLRIFGQPPLVALCWDCERLRCALCAKLYTAKAPPEAQGDKFAESAVSILALLHYGAGMPFFRLERLQHNLQTPVPSSTQWDVLNPAADQIRPVYEELFVRAAQAKRMHADDTTMPILQFMGKRRDKLVEQDALSDPERTGLFTTGIVAITDDDREIVLLGTGRKHAGENLDDLLDKRLAELQPPLLMADALSRNVPKRHAVIEANCNCHARRGVVDEVANFPEQCRYILEQYAEVFKNESTCKKRGLSEQQRLAFHQQHSGPVMDRIKAWILQQFDDKLIEPNSAMGKALNYILNHWDKLTAFLRIAGAPIDNNLVERALKRAILHRKNSLFYRSQRGAEVGDMFMTLIHTAERNGVNAFDYLGALLTHATAVANDPADWLPWNYQDTLAPLVAQPELREPPPVPPTCADRQAPSRRCPRPAGARPSSSTPPVHPSGPVTPPPHP